MSARSVVTLLAALLMAACGKSEPPAPQTAEEAQARREAAAREAREGTVAGSQLRSMDKAKEAAEAAVKKSEERAKSAD